MSRLKLKAKHLSLSKILHLTHAPNNLLDYLVLVPVNVMAYDMFWVTW